MLPFRLPFPPHLPLALLAGGIMQFAFSPYDHAWLAVPALAGWFLLLHRGNPFVTGWAFGFGWFGLGAWWLADTFHTYGDLPYIVALLCVALIGLVMGLLPALWGWAACRLAGSHIEMRLLTLPAVGLLEEWLRGHLFTGLPWTALGNLTLDTPAVGWGAVAGVYGLTLLPVLVAGALACLLYRKHWQWGAAGMGVALLLTLLTPPPYPADGREGRAALVQASIPQDVKWDAAFLNETMRRFDDLSSSAAAEADLIVWPEAAVPFFLSSAPGWERWLTGRMNAWGKPVLFGGLRQIASSEGKRIAQNGLWLFDPTTGRRSFAGKQHLVPFGEYVPSWIPFLHKLVPNIADFRPATDSGVLTYDGSTYGALICYESIFPEEVRRRVAAGARLLVVVTNDAWYDKSPAAWQHLQASRMRAVESGRYVLRAANTGVSAIIAPDGKITATVPWWTQAVVRGTYRLSETITPYEQWGDTPALILAALLLVPAAVRRRT